MSKESTENKVQALLREAQKRLELAMEAEGDNRQKALEDLEFIAIEGAQWPAAIRAMRESDDRPCLSINKMPTYLDQVVGDQRMNRPSVKVVPVDSKADPEVARILGGWIKHVQQVSKADVAIDNAFEHAVAGGYGALRVVTKYVSDFSFDQEAFIQVIENALAVFFGPHEEYDCSDAMYCFIITDLPRDEYRQKYKLDPMPFNKADSRFVEGWATKDTVRVAEYFVKEPVTKTLYELADGTLTHKLAEGQSDLVVRKRRVDTYKIKWYLISGDAILEESDWMGKKYIPVIPVWGKQLNVGGRKILRGLIRHGKDSQRQLNYWNSVDTEVIALQPKSPFLVTPAQIAGHESQWKLAHKQSFPYLLVNPDTKAPGWPKREAPPQASSAFVTKIQQTDQDIRDTIGLQKAALGMQSNERSGVAIRERKMEGDVGTFAFADNLSRSIEHLGRVLIDLAPGILDTRRIIRLGLDNGEFEHVEVNVPTGEKDEMTGEAIIGNNMQIGTYDIVATVGPSFTTQRAEAKQSMSEFIQYVPDVAPLIIDLYAKNMDWPGAEEFAERLEYLLPPEVRAQKAAKAAQGQGASASPPTEAPAPQNEPSPEEALNSELAMIKLQEAKMKLEQEKAKLAGLLLINKGKMVELGMEAEGVTTDDIIGPVIEQDKVASTSSPGSETSAEIGTGTETENMPNIASNASSFTTEESGVHEMSNGLQLQLPENMLPMEEGV